MNRHTSRFSSGTQIAIVAIAAFVVIVIWFACVFNSFLDFLVAIWTVLFCAVFGLCVFAIIAVLLYDYMIHK